MNVISIKIRLIFASTGLESIAEGMEIRGTALIWTLGPGKVLSHSLPGWAIDQQLMWRYRGDENELFELIWLHEEMERETFQL